VRRSRRQGRQRRTTWWGPVYALPGIAFIVAFAGYPLVTMAYHALTSWSGLSPPSFIGLRNFTHLFHDPVFRTAIENNVLFALSVPIIAVSALLLAYLIHSRIPGWRVFRATFFLPAVFSTVVIGIIVSLMLQPTGPVDSALRDVGLGALAANWLDHRLSAVWVIIVVVSWANFGYSMLIYLAGMGSVDDELEDAARVDGARFWQILWRVYLPNMRRVVELVLVINTVTAFAYMFTYIYTITNGGPGFDTYTTEYYIYNAAFTFQELGYACALGVVLVLIIAGLGIFQIRVLTRGTLR
jgi:multiple sugar transport system permease protein